MVYTTDSSDPTPPPPGTESTPQRQGGEGGASSTTTIGADGNVTTTSNSPSPGGTAAAAGGDVSPLLYDSRAMTGHVGLINQGATCYMNSLLQLFFHISYFREAVYRMTTGESDESEIPKAVQNLFFQMQERSSAASTKCLTDAFGWDEREVFIQHDVQELAGKLRDTLESKMKGTPAEGAINRMFTGFGQTVTTTMDDTFTSRRKDEFYDVHLPVRDYRSMEESLKSLVAKDKLVGSNQYKVEEEGKAAVYKDAETGYEYTQFPPVLVFHLKRFEMDMMSPTLEMKKVNSQFDFATTIDLSSYENPNAESQRKCRMKPLTDDLPNPTPNPSTTSFDGDSVSDAIYDLYGVIVHRGGVRSGHYYAFIREYDVATQDWTRWLKYDDDEVTEVHETAAVDRNFGGVMYQLIGGRQVPATSTHSAYILCYMRRSEISKLIYPISTDAIPRHVKDELRRVMEEDERRQEEEEARNRTVTFHFVNDATIKDFVARNTYELIPLPSMSADFGAAFSITLQKSNTVTDLYQVMKQRNFFPCRLWRWGQTIQGGQPRPDRLFQELDGSEADQMTLREALGARAQGEEHKPWSEVFYIEESRLYHHTSVTNLVSTDLVSANMSSANVNQEELRAVLKANPISVLRFEVQDRNPTLTLEFSRSYPVTTVSFKVVLPRASPYYESNLHVAIYDQDPSSPQSKPTWQGKRSATPSHNSTGVFLLFPTPGYVDPVNAPKGKWVQIQRIDMKALPPLQINRVAVHTVPESLPSHQKGMVSKPLLPECNVSSHLHLMVKLFNHRLAKISFLGMAIVPKMEPLRNSFPQLRHMMGLPPDSKQSLVLFDESKPYQTVKIDEGHNCTSAEANLFNGNIVTVQLDPRYIPLVYRFLQANQLYEYIDCMRTITLHDIAQPDSAFTLSMQGWWKHSDIVEAIGECIQVNPDFLRIFGPQGFHHTRPRAEPERSESSQTLDQIVSVGNWSLFDIFYEVLPLTLKDVESKISFSLRVCDEKGEQLTDEVSFELPIRSTAESVIKTLLSKLDQAQAVELVQRYKGYFVLVDRGPHVIYHWYPIHIPTKKIAEGENDDDEDELEPTSLAASPGASYTIDRLRKDRIYEVRGYLRPGPGERDTPCGHGDQSASHSYTQPHGIPFLIPLPKEESCDDALERLIAFTGIDPEGLENGNDSTKCFKLMIFTDCMMSLPDWSVALHAYISGTRRSEGHPTHAFLNHKKPKEKPGSRYIPMYEPQLVLEKKKTLPASKSTDNVAAAAATTTATVDDMKKFIAGESPQ